MSIRKIATNQGDDYTTCFKDYYNIIAIDLGKQQAFDVNPKAIQQIDFRGSLGREENANTAIVLIIEEAKETALDFSEGTAKVF